MFEYLNDNHLKLQVENYKSCFTVQVTKTLGKDRYLFKFYVNNLSELEGCLKKHYATHQEIEEMKDVFNRSLEDEPCLS